MPPCRKRNSLHTFLFILQTKAFRVFSCATSENHACSGTSMTALWASSDLRLEFGLSFPAFVGGAVAGLVVRASCGNLIRRAPCTLPNRPCHGVGCLGHLLQRDLSIFPPAAAGFERQGNTSPGANRTNVVRGCDRCAPRTYRTHLHP